MKSLWNAISFLAVVHLLALVMFGGWLWQSGRLSAERMESLRELFARSVADEQAQAERNDVQAQPAVDEASSTGMDSASHIARLASLKDFEAQSRQRLEAERQMLLQQIQDASAKAAKATSAAKARDAERDQAHAADASRRNDEQFLLAVRQLEQLTPKQGKRVLIELVQQNQHDIAVKYLIAMNSRASSKILKEFKTDEEMQLATELLERLRTYDSDAIDAPPATAPVSSAHQLGSKHETAIAHSWPAAAHDLKGIIGFAT